MTLEGHQNNQLQSKYHKEDVTIHAILDEVGTSNILATLSYENP
jgi:hypothetical protein